MKFGTILIVSVFLFIAGCTVSSERRKVDSEIYLEIAKEYIEAGLYDKALSEAENALKAFPQNYSARYLKIDTLAKLGRFDEALAELKTAAKKLPEEELYRTEHWAGVVYYHKGDLDKAVAHLERSAGMNPEFKENHILLSRIYPEVSLIEKAIAHSVKWTELEPGAGRAWEDLGIRYVMARDFQKAKETLDRAISINPESHMAYNYLGRWADEQNRWEEAEKYYVKSLQLGETNPYVYLSLGQLMMLTGRLDEAYPYLEKSNLLNPNVEFTNYWLGKYHLEKGDYDKAMEYFNKAIGLKPTFSVARAGVADASLNSGKNFVGAITVLKEGLERTPADQKGFYYYLGKLYLARNKLKTAMNYAEKAFDLLEESADEELADLHLLKGKILEKQGDKKGARVEYRRTVKLTPASESAKKAKKLLKN